MRTVKCRSSGSPNRVKAIAASNAPTIFAPADDNRPPDTGDGARLVRRRCSRVGFDSWSADFPIALSSPLRLLIRSSSRIQLSFQLRSNDSTRLGKCRRDPGSGAFLPGPEGAEHISPGQRSGNRSAPTNGALKGRHTRRPTARLSRPFRAGLGGRRRPGALPRADLLRPFGARKHRNRPTPRVPVPSCKDSLKCGETDEPRPLLGPERLHPATLEALRRSGSSSRPEDSLTGW